MGESINSSADCTEVATTTTTTSSHDTERTAAFPDENDVELLGRQRPADFANDFQEWGFVLAVVGAAIVSEYTVDGYNLVMPSVTKALDIPESSRTWPSEVASFTTAILLLPFARLSEMYGGRMVFLGGLLWLGVWSLISGFCKNSTLLIACRAMQGLGNSAFLPATLAIMGQTYRPGPRKNLVFGIFGAFTVVGFYIGIVLGAVSAQLLDWRWYFWFDAIFSIAIFAIGLFSIPRNLGGNDPTARMDWGGLFTIVPGLSLVVYALTDGGRAPDGWRTPYIYVTFILGVLFLIGAVYLQGWVAAQPLLPAGIFRPKYMKRITIALFLGYGTFGVFLFYASYYIQTVVALSPLQTAVWFFPLCGGGFTLSILGGFFLHRLPNRVLLVISGAGYIISVLLFALIPTHGESNTHLYWAYVFPAMLGATIGLDISFNVTNVYMTTVLPARLQAVCGALINSLVFLGIAFWLGVTSLVESVVQEYRGDHYDLSDQFKVGFWLGVGLASTSFCLFLTIDLKTAGADLTADEKEKMME